MKKNNAEDDEWAGCPEIPELTDEDLATLAEGAEEEFRRESVLESPSSNEDLDRAHSQADLDAKRKKLEFQIKMIAWTRRVVRRYLAFVALVLLAYFIFYYMKYGVISEKEIIITLLASTTASIIGLPFAINKSIFIDKEK
jgi:hypothetical protein